MRSPLAGGIRNVRRYLVGLAALVLVAAGAYGVYAGIQYTKSCEPAPASDSASGAIAGNFDSGMSGVCRFACATKTDYKAADVLAQPGAQSGKLTQCPVSGVVFLVDVGRPRVPVEGEDFVACCGNCAAKLQHDPGHYLKS